MTLSGKKQMKPKNLPLHLMLLPAVILVVIFSYGPMFGIVIAFQKFNPALGFIDSKWVGLRNFELVFSNPDISSILFNTFYIAVLKIAWGIIVPVIVALMLNEVRYKAIKQSVQTLIYLPYFLSWVILGGIVLDIFALDGPINAILQVLGIDPIFFLGDNRWFRPLLIFTDTWKNYGFGTIIYLAAISNISVELYEAAVLDGANRWRQTWHITLPGMRPTIVLITTLSLGGILNAGFEQIFNLYSPIVYETSDIIDTLVYRMGIIQAQYGPAAAMGLMKSGVSLVLVAASYLLAYRLADYRIF